MSKSICIISPSLRMGGIERALSVLANYFVNEGYSVAFISCLPGQHFYKLKNEINFIEPGFNHSTKGLNKVIFYLRVGCFIRQNVIKIQPDVVMAFGDWFNPLVILALSGLKYPIFISDRTSPDYKFKFPISQLKRWLYPKSAGFIAQTRRAADFRSRQFNNKLKVRIIPNALREVKLYPEIKREKIILYVGRFSWEKGPERLIRAFNAIPDRQGWQLHMAGSGPLVNKMNQLVSDMKIGDEVVFYGNVQDVDRLYARAGLYVLPSLLEGFPNSLCEAMAAGLPCVCFDSIPYEDIFNHNYVDGIVVSDANLEELKSILLLLMGDQELRERLGTRAKEIRDRLSIKSIGNRVVEFIFEK